ncbi:MAG: hypothetical protein JSS49_17615 [Planctomycetes bacterium]|nr:hypothetical protein [Planctomycetota bacterium]
MTLPSEEMMWQSLECAHNNPLHAAMSTIQCIGDTPTPAIGLANLDWSIW